MLEIKPIDSQQFWAFPYKVKSLFRVLSLCLFRSRFVDEKYFTTSAGWIDFSFGQSRQRMTPYRVFVTLSSL